MALVAMGKRRSARRLLSCRREKCEITQAQAHWLKCVARATLPTGAPSSKPLAKPWLKECSPCLFSFLSFFSHGVGLGMRRPRHADAWQLASDVLWLRLARLTSNGASMTQ